MNNINENNIHNAMLNHTEALAGLADSEQLKLITNINNNMKRYMLVLDFSGDDQAYDTLKKTAPELLMAFNDMDRLHDYYNEFIRKITAKTTMTDAEELIHTLEAFTEKCGDYHESAKALHLHVNTVRYRINKIRKYLGLENDVIVFHEKISIMMRIKQCIDKTFSEGTVRN